MGTLLALVRCQPHENKEKRRGRGLHLRSSTSTQWTTYGKGELNSGVPKKGEYQLHPVRPLSNLPFARRSPPCKCTPHPFFEHVGWWFEAHNTNEAMLNVHASGMARTETKREIETAPYFSFYVFPPPPKTIKTKGRGCGETHTPKNKITILATSALLMISYPPPLSFNRYGRLPHQRRVSFRRARPSVRSLPTFRHCQ